jgi:hypothetical protein
MDTLILRKYLYLGSEHVSIAAAGEGSETLSPEDRCSVFLVMVVTTMQILRLGGGFQQVAQGCLSILVLTVATARGA